MGNAFNPVVHWTSVLRGKAGLPPITHCTMNNSTFSINDKTGALTRFLAHNGYKAAGSWSEPPFYHLEVVTTEGDVNSPFQLDPQQVDKVPLHYLSGCRPCYAKLVYLGSKVLAISKQHLPTPIS